MDVYVVHRSHTRQKTQEEPLDSISKLEDGLAKECRKGRCKKGRCRRGLPRTDCTRGTNVGNPQTHTDSLGSGNLILAFRLLWTEARPSRTHCGDLCLVKSKWFRLSCSAAVDVSLPPLCLLSFLQTPNCETDISDDGPVIRMHLERRVSPLCIDSPCSDHHGMVLFGWFQEHA